MIPAYLSVRRWGEWMYCLLLLDKVMLCFSAKFKLLIGWLHYVVNSRWEEERYTDGVKWKFLEHKGPVFAPPYEPLPSNVKFYYDGKNVSPTRALGFYISQELTVDDVMTCF